MRLAVAAEKLPKSQPAQEATEAVAGCPRGARCASPSGWRPHARCQVKQVEGIARPAAHTAPTEPAERSASRRRPPKALAAASRADGRVEAVGSASGATTDSTALRFPVPFHHVEHSCSVI